MSFADLARRNTLTRSKRGLSAGSLGNLAATIAHDMNNQLAIVSGSLDLLELQLAADPAALHRILIAQNASARCASLTQRLAAVADDQRPTPIDRDDAEIPALPRPADKPASH